MQRPTFSTNASMTLKGQGRPYRYDTERPTAAITTKSPECDQHVGASMFCCYGATW